MLTALAVLLLFAAAALLGVLTALFDFGYRFGTWLMEKLWPAK